MQLIFVLAINIIISKQTKVAIITSQNQNSDEDGLVHQVFPM